MLLSTSIVSPVSDVSFEHCIMYWEGCSATRDRYSCHGDVLGKTPYVFLFSFLIFIDKEDEYKETNPINVSEQLINTSYKCYIYFVCHF